MVSEKYEEQARQLEKQLAEAGLRVCGDYRAQKIGAKIRDAQLELIPYMLIVGREMAEGKVSVRDRIDGDLGRCRSRRPWTSCRPRCAAKTVRRVVKTSAGMGGRGEANVD